MAYPRTVRNFNAFIDGVGYFGRAEQATLPSLELNTEEHRGAGMDAAIEIDMGMTAMTAEIGFVEWSPELYTHFGNKPRLVLRPAAMGESDDQVDEKIYTIGGLWKTVGHDQMQPGQNTMIKLTCAVRYYRVEHNGEELVEIDVENGVRRIGGTDQMRNLRQAMGI